MPVTGIRTTSLLVLALIFVAAISAAAQGTPPDLKAITASVTDPKSDRYWPLLFQRYQSGDTTLSTEEQRCLYYGYTAQENYSGYGSSGFEDSMRKALRTDGMLPGDWARVLHFTDSIIAKTPFSLRYLNYRARAARELGNKPLYEKTIAQLAAVGQAIQSTGDGLSEKTAFWVISIPDEYSMIARLGYEYGGRQSLVDGPCDRLALTQRDGSPEALYFNVSILFGDMEKMLGGDKKKRKKRR